MIQAGNDFKMRRSKRQWQRYEMYDDIKSAQYYKKGLADEDGALYPSTSADPVPARRLTRGRKKQAATMQANFGSVNWDHSYSHYPL